MILKNNFIDRFSPSELVYLFFWLEYLMILRIKFVFLIFIKSESWHLLFGNDFKSWGIFQIFKPIRFTLLQYFLITFIILTKGCPHCRSGGHIYVSLSIWLHLRTVAIEFRLSFGSTHALIYVSSHAAGKKVTHRGMMSLKSPSIFRSAWIIWYIVKFYTVIASFFLKTFTWFLRTFQTMLKNSIINPRGFFNNFLSRFLYLFKIFNFIIE